MLSQSLKCAIILYASSCSMQRFSRLTSRVRHHTSLACMTSHSSHAGACPVQLIIAPLHIFVLSLGNCAMEAMVSRVEVERGVEALAVAHTGRQRNAIAVHCLDLLWRQVPKARRRWCVRFERGTRTMRNKHVKRVAEVIFLRVHAPAETEVMLVL